MDAIDWDRCLTALKADVPEKEFNTWVRPLHTVHFPNGLKLLAPNRFAVDWVNAHLLPRLLSLLSQAGFGHSPIISVEIGSRDTAPAALVPQPLTISQRRGTRDLVPSTPLHADWTFNTFIRGRCNALAYDAAFEIAMKPGHAYNPMFLYGGVGLGKTHLTQAIAHMTRQRDPGARVEYVHSERFVSDMVRALQHNSMSEFKAAYRSLDALMIDDIQFFANKDRSQEEFFHTFNALLEGQHQIIVTCDRYPKEIDGLEERLKSRFCSGLAVAIDPPELETSAAILISKAHHAGVILPEDVAFFIGKRIRSDVRELEGALRRVVADSRFTGHPITVESTREALKDLLSLQSKLVTIESIQRSVADYCKVRVADLLSKRRSRSVARPRQLAMALAKELTSHSLPEIGNAFGGRDHTTVLHACKRIKELRNTEARMSQDYSNLLRTLTR